jgi:hypothetical protein
LRARYADISNNFRAAWDIYIKFYTVFLTFSAAAMAFVIAQGSSLGHILTIKYLFAANSILLSLTSVFLTRYSSDAAERHTEIEISLSGPQSRLSGSKGSIPLGLAQWSGWANAVVMIGMAWIWMFGL